MGRAPRRLQALYNFDASLVTPAQLVRRSETYTRETSRAYVTFLLPSIIFVPGIVAFVYFLGRDWDATLATGVLGAIWLPAGLVLLRRGAAWRARALGLLCPSCGRPCIAPASPGDEHGNCQQCGTPLIEPAGAPERALFTRLGYARNQARTLSVQRKMYGAWFLLIIGIAVAFPIALTLWPGSARGAETLFGIGTIGLIGIGGIVITVLESVQRRRALLACPDCRTELVDEYGNAALIDGRCPQCGLLIVDDSAPVQRSGLRRSGVPPPASAAELAERNARLEYGTRYEYAIVVPLSVGGIVAAEVLLFVHRRGSPAFFIWMMIGCLGMIGILLYANKIWQRRARRLGLTCPVCGELLVGGPESVVLRFVAEHGACKFCGTILWDAKESTAPAVRQTTPRS